MATDTRSPRNSTYCTSTLQQPGRTQDCSREQPDKLWSTGKLGNARAQFIQIINDAEDKTITRYAKRDPSGRLKRLSYYTMDIVNLLRPAPRLYSNCRTESNRRIQLELQTDKQNSIRHWKNIKILKLLC